MRNLNFSSRLFLLGCAALPFFNDFPLLRFVTPSFLDLSLPFFILSVIFLLSESAIFGEGVLIDKSAVKFFFIVLLVIFASLIANLSKSSVVCGIEECGGERMFKTLAADVIKFALIPFLVLFINKVGMERVAIYVRRGFYMSFAYVSIELLLSFIPSLIGIGRLEAMNLIDSIFHARINNWGPMRTRGLSFEPGYQGAYLIFCLPFIFSDTREKCRRRNLFMWFVSLVTTGAPGAVLAALVFFVAFDFKSKKSSLIKVFFIFFIFLFAVLFFSKILGVSDFISTITRTGSWVASLLAILDNVFWGVGPGMSGYWIINYYPDFFYNSPEAGGWWQSGIDYMNAPTFSSFFNFTLNYGLVSIVTISLFFYIAGFWKNIFSSNFGKSAFLSFFVVSFTITSYQVLAYLLFMSIVLCNGWVCLDRISSGYVSRQYDRVRHVSL
jgi:hypothetical protein